MQVLLCNSEREGEREGGRRWCVRPEENRAAVCWMLISSNTAAAGHSWATAHTQPSLAQLSSFAGDCELTDSQPPRKLELKSFNMTWVVWALWVSSLSEQNIILNIENNNKSTAVQWSRTATAQFKYDWTNKRKTKRKTTSRGSWG